MKIISLFVFLFLFCFLSTLAQDLNQVYKTNIPLHQDIVSGGLYVDPPKNLEGNPYFKSKSFTNSSITINGLQYDSVPIMYSVYEDEVLTFQPIHFKKIIIRADKINEFTLLVDDTYKFIRVENNKSYPYHRNGLYELLVDGEAQLLAKHYKLTKPKRDVSKYVGEFYERTDYFLSKQDTIYAIKRKKQAFEILGLERRRLRADLRSRGLNFKANPKEFLKYLTETYND